MNPDEFIKLPDNRPWRLEHVEEIVHTKNGFYSAICYFQHLKPWVVDNYRNGDDLKSIKSFDSTYAITREVNLEYIRCFPIGSIWQKGQQPILPNYFGEFLIAPTALKGLKPTFGYIGDYVEDVFLSSRKDGKHFETDCLVFKPKKRLFAKKQADETYSVSKEKGGTELTFIKFIGYEVYRSFLTSRTDGTLNHRMLSSRRSSNLIYDNSRTKIIDSKRQVYLKNEKDHPNIFLIGNAIYEEKFKFAMRRIIARVSKKDGTERVFGGMELPFDTFNRMKVYAKLVKIENEKDKWGLVVFQIAETQGYQKGTYFPLTDRMLTELQKDGNVRFRVKRTKSKIKSKQQFENSPVNSDGDDDVKVEDNDLFGLMNPPLDKTLPQMTIELVDDEGKVVFLGKKEKPGGKLKVGPSGESQDPDGSQVIISLESMNYFPLFPRIVEKVRISLSTRYSAVQIEWLHSSGQRYSSNPNCKRSYKEDNGIAGKLGYGCVEIKFGNHHFYLCEKELDRVNSENRSWLFAFPKFRVIRNIEMEPAIKKFIFDPDRSWKIGALTEVDLEMTDHLNHKNVLPERLVVDDAEMESFRKFAIEKYSKKIIRMIINKINDVQ